MCIGLGLYNHQSISSGTTTASGKRLEDAFDVGQRELQVERRTYGPGTTARGSDTPVGGQLPEALQTCMSD